MKNGVQVGHTVTAIAPDGGVLSGVILVIGSVAMVPVTSASKGESVEVDVCGVFDLPKKTGAAAGQFTPAYLTSEGEITATEGTNVLVGYFTEDRLAADVSCHVSIGRALV